jgi:hypothetical protein
MSVVPTVKNCLKFDVNADLIVCLAVRPHTTDYVDCAYVRKLGYSNVFFHCPVGRQAGKQRP